MTVGGVESGSLPGLWSYLLQVLIALAVIVALAAGVLYLMRRFVPAVRSGRRLQIVESVAVDPRRTLHIVKVGKRHLLVGSTEGSLSLLAELDDEDVAAADPPEPPSRRFVDVLRSLGR